MRNLWNRSIVVRIAVMVLVVIALSLGSYQAGFGAGVTEGKESSVSVDKAIRQELGKLYPDRHFTVIRDLYIGLDAEQPLGSTVLFTITGKADYELLGAE